MGTVFKVQEAPTVNVAGTGDSFPVHRNFVWVKIMRITFGRWEQIRNDKRLFSSANLQMQFVRKVLNCHILWQLLICTMK